jgi:membrane protein DedA with SNARE-associated domain
VISIAFLGTFAGDQLDFQIGRLKGTTLLQKIPRWQARMRKVNSLLVRYRHGIILGFRFLYGIRTITPFILGMTTIPKLN